jgi:metal-responsive CopG/Arc/MetJ family transcriptional regulator
MPSTTFHIPDELLRKVDRAAQNLRVSRNRFVLQACEAALARQAGEWPQGFFDSSYGNEDKTLIVQATRELEKEVLSRRTNRGATAL